MIPNITFAPRMFKSVASIFIVLLMMTQSMTQLGILTWYQLNKSGIIDKYCENKDKPEMCCEGKCFIGKQLVNTSETLPNPRTFEESDMPFFEVLTSDFTFKIHPIIAVLSTDSDDFLDNGHIFELTKPPKCLIVTA